MKDIKGSQAIAGSPENNTQLIDDDYLSRPRGRSGGARLLAAAIRRRPDGFTGSQEYFKDYTR